MPSQCTQEDIRERFESDMIRQYSNLFENNEKLDVSFPDQETPSVGIGTILTLILFFILLLIIIFGTIVDRTSILQNPAYVHPLVNRESEEEQYNSNNDYLRKTSVGNFFSSFSVPRNFNRIFYEPFRMQKELRVLNGVYVVSLILVILNNTYFISSMYGIVEGSSFTKYKSNLFHFILLRLHLVYELYFFSIGFICCIKLWTMYYLNNYKGTMLLEILRLIYRRWIPMVFIILYSVFIFQFTGSGPLFQF